MGEPARTLLGERLHALRQTRHFARRGALMKDALVGAADDFRLRRLAKPLERPWRRPRRSLPRPCGYEVRTRLFRAVLMASRRLPLRAALAAERIFAMWIIPRKFLHCCPGAAGYRRGSKSPSTRNCPRQSVSDARTLAFRFSTKAAMPSFWSAVANIEWKSRRSNLHALRKRGLVGAVDRLLRHHRNRQRHFRDRLGNLHRLIDKFGHRNHPADEPERSASAASIIRPVKHISIALDFPTKRVSRCVPPNPGITPSLISGWPNFALSPANDEVAHHRKLAPAAERKSRNRRDHRLAAARNRAPISA